MDIPINILPSASDNAAFGTTAYRAGRTATEVSQKRYRYTGKEKDEETGFHYHGARYYVPWICRWASVDPLKEERAWVTPYNYAQNSPINRIDENGMLDDWWVVDKKGYLVHVASRPTENYDVLFPAYLNATGQNERTSNGIPIVEDQNNDGYISEEDGIIIKNQSILKQLKENDISRENISSEDVFKIFKFMADNTVVEWSFSKYVSHDNIYYAIWTKHDTEATPSASTFGINNETVHIHSHPCISIDYRSEMLSMGAKWTDEYGGYYYKMLYAPIGNGIPDWQRVYESDRNTVEYVYFHESNNLYYLQKGEWDKPLLIKNIKNSTDFNFGILR